MRDAQSDIAIVVTGTITPTSNYTKNRDPAKRRAEYLNSLKYYSAFGEVFFLENSGYDLAGDRDFSELERVHLRPMPVDMDSTHSIGYQEFHMLDTWLAAEQEMPRKWVKLSGRYIIENFPKLMHQFQTTDKDLVMDVYMYRKWADTWLFCITTEYWEEHFKGKYIVSQPYLAIETVLYCYLRWHAFPSVDCFVEGPRFSIVSSEGTAVDVNHSLWARLLDWLRCRKLAETRTGGVILVSLYKITMPVSVEKVSRFLGLSSR